MERDHEVPRSDRLAESALSAEVLTKALRKIQSKRLLVVIDSCHMLSFNVFRANKKFLLQLPVCLKYLLVFSQETGFLLLF